VTGFLQDLIGSLGTSAVQGARLLELSGHKVKRINAESQVRHHLLAEAIGKLLIVLSSARETGCSSASMTHPKLLI